MAFVNLLRLYLHLKKFPAILDVKAHQDPTMLFSGIVWGDQLARQRHLSESFWPLKVALFQCGDRIIEKVINHCGLSPFKEHFLNNESEDYFYLFADDMVDHDMRVDNQMMRRGYELCEDKLKKYFSDDSQLVLNDWVVATNLAIRSVFVLDAWANALKSQDSDTLLLLVQDEEKCKNIDVVMQLLSVARHFDESFNHEQTENIVACCSHWFTLIDDFLDLKQDYQDHQPNYLIAQLVINGSFERLKDLAQFKSLEQLCPRTAQWYQSELNLARNKFIETFPVFPRFFCHMIEKRARDKGQSPF